MEVPNVENLLDYVFTPGEGDFNLTPSMQEYKKLQRVMKVMINFYKRGAETKGKQLDSLREEIQKLETDEQMILDQIKELDQFPPFHPKKQEYDGQLEDELEKLRDLKTQFKGKEAGFKELHDWSLKIVDTVEWLGRQLEAYCNHQLKTELAVEPGSAQVTVEQFKIFKRGLDEITFNLQESQDFFNASLDGRLRQFHQLEKCMIEAQLQAIRKYPETNLRRKHVEEELLKDLEYVSNNMKEDPKVVLHRERMRDMHVDFFALLKWQREKLLRLPWDEPAFVTGSVDEVKTFLEEQKDQVDRPADDSHAGSAAAVAAMQAAPALQKTAPAPAAEESVCPVVHIPKKAATPAANGAEGDLKIHRLYDNEKHPSLVFGEEK